MDEYQPFEIPETPVYPHFRIGAQKKEQWDGNHGLQYKEQHAFMVPCFDHPFKSQPEGNHAGDGYDARVDSHFDDPPEPRLNMEQELFQQPVGKIHDSIFSPPKGTNVSG